MSSPRSWTVVVFEEDQTVQAVPTKWIIGDQCLWPTLPQDKLNVALKNCDYNTCWPSHKIRILRNGTFGDYSLARGKARKAEFTSDLSTDTDEGHRKRKKKLFSSSDSDEDNFNNKKKHPLKSLPPPPQMSSYEQNSLGNLNEEDICIDNVTHTTCTSTANKLINEQNTPKHIRTLGSPGTLRPLEARSAMRERSSTSCRNMCEVCCNKTDKSLYVMSSLLVELNGKVDRLLKRDVSVEAITETCILVKANLQFPIDSVTIFEKFNLFLEEQENYSGLVKYFSKIGGASLTEFIKRCLAPLLNDELSIRFSYLGKKGNLNFSKSNLAKAILDAAEKTSTSNRKEVETAIAAWLRRAPERKRRSVCA